VLKAIEDHRISRLGSTREIPVDVHIIAATNKDLRQLVSAGQFREDLFHRLDLFRIQIPPLRARGEEILQLAETLIERLCRKHRLPRKPFSAEGRRRLTSYPWPGNVRELAHELERAIVSEESAELNFEPLQIPGHAAATGPDGWFNPEFRFPEHGFDLEKAIHRLIEHALTQADNNVSAAARLLGVSRDYIRYRQPNQEELPGPSS